MTRDDDDARPKRTDVGYGRPPKEHQFQKGMCPNPRGRPRKTERSLSLRQIRRDVLSVLEEPIAIRTAQGEERMPAILAMVKVLRGKAMSGHGPSLRFMLKLHREAVAEHHAAHDREFEVLEDMERFAAANDVLQDPEFIAVLNEFRKRTRRT